MSEDMNQARTFEVLTAEPIRKRRKPKFWSDVSGCLKVRLNGAEALTDDLLCH
jgi:hypothetical protein